MVAVPLPLSVKVMPVGSAPDSVSVGAGAPVVVTVKLNGAPTMEVADAALVIVGATFSVRVVEEPRAHAQPVRQLAAVGVQGGGRAADGGAGGHGDGHVDRPGAAVVDGDHAVGLAGGHRRAGLGQGRDQAVWSARTLPMPPRVSCT